MSQVHDAGLAFHRAAPRSGSVLKSCLDAVARRLRILVTDGLTADAFLVLEGQESIAVLLRRGEGYVVVARKDALASLDGQFFGESSLALDAVRRIVPTPVTLSPVWYS